MVRAGEEEVGCRRVRKRGGADEKINKKVEKKAAKKVICFE